MPDARVDRQAGEVKPTYAPPRITVMDEKEVLKAFQVTSAGTGWWVAGVGGSM